MKITKKELSYILYIFGIVFAIAGVVYGNSLRTKSTALKTENASLTSEVTYLQDLTNHKQEYLDEIDRMNLEMDEIKSQFPVDIFPENQIMYANGLESQFEVMLDSINMPGMVSVDVATVAAQPATTTTTTDATATDATATDASATTAAAQPATTTLATSILLSKAETSFEYQASYSGLKNFIKYINEDVDRKSIERLSVDYDNESGNLTGDIVVNMYALSGTGKDYVAPVVTGVSDGKGAIFTGATVLNRKVENRSGDAATADGKAAGEEAADDAADEEDEANAKAGKTEE